MENFLFEQKIISNKSYYASIGGGYDLGTQLGTEGKKNCEQSIYSNGLELLNIGDKGGNQGTVMAYIKLGDTNENDYLRIISSAITAIS